MEQPLLAQINRSIKANERAIKELQGNNELLKSIRRKLVKQKWGDTAKTAGLFRATSPSPEQAVKESPESSKVRRKKKPP